MSHMSENKPDNNRPVDPVSRLRSALDRIAFALELRQKEERERVPDPVPAAKEKGPEVEKAIATLDALMVDVKNVLEGLSSVHPEGEPAETIEEFSSSEPSYSERDPVPGEQDSYEGWRDLPERDGSHHGGGY